MLKFDIEPLFAPAQLGAVTLPNRFVLPGMQRGWCDNGAPTARLIDYYKRRVTGGVGLIISESVAVDHPSATQADLFARLDDTTFDAWKTAIGAVKDAGGHMLVQLWHEGAIRKEGGDGPLAHHPTLSPSGLAHGDHANGRAATTQEVREMRDAFLRSALLAQRAGADGVEVHAAHGYLLDQFLWEITNRRMDEYGGNGIADRVRLPAEIVAGIRAACGPDFIVSVRYSQWKEADFGARIAHTPDELRTMLAALATAGATVLHASTRRFWMPEWPDSDLNLAGWSKKLSGLPVITVGSVGLSSDVMDSFAGKTVTARTEETLEELARRYRAGEFDFVSVGRSLIADPDWVAKVRQGDYAAIKLFSPADLAL